MCCLFCLSLSLWKDFTKFLHQCTFKRLANDAVGKEPVRGKNLYGGDVAGWQQALENEHNAWPMEGVCAQLGENGSNARLGSSNPLLQPLTLLYIAIKASKQMTSLWSEKGSTATRIVGRQLLRRSSSDSLYHFRASCVGLSSRRGSSGAVMESCADQMSIAWMVDGYVAKIQAEERAIQKWRHCSC